ncbi:serine/threonine protein kinase [Candidatus Uabimicrobium sp. HlEnr_7]|uniref:serine/threonine protein kinase n=1 Tax=Candidatus Uabimicrobium helgolandensis TaxID=3095367 RepID=UPI00355744B9
MEDMWFVRGKLDGNIFGPYTTKKIEMYIKNGRMGKDFALSKDKTNWIDAESWTPKMIGKYEVLRELGRGGMGAVYLVYDSDLQRKCALKLILNKDNKEAIKRFQVEAKAVAQIQHPNIIRIYDIYEEPYHFFVMDYVEGVSLSQYITDLSIEKKVELFAKICAAMVYAHGENILHRDLKPENILVRKNGEPVIVDFGLAKNIEQENGLTKTGEIFGTLTYMAPEIAKGKGGNHRADIYALGVILYEMLTGRVPFDGENQVELLYQLTLSEPIPPSRLNVSIPKEGDLETICLKALEKTPERRISSTEFLYKEIQSYLDKEPIRLKPPGFIHKLVKNIFKNAIIILSGITIIFGCISLAIFYQKEKTRKTKELLEALVTSFDGHIQVIKANKKTIDDYLLSKSDEQFFHLSVIEKFKDLHKKIKAERILYITYDNIQKTKHDLEKNHSGDATEVLQLADNALSKEEKWLPKYYKKHKKENARYYRRLDNHLRFSVLPNFPEKKSHVFETEPLSICVSPKSNYILQKIQEDWLLWKKHEKEGFSQKSVSTLVGLPKNLKKSKCIFSPDENLIIIEDQGYLHFVEVAKKRKFISFEGYLNNISFDSQGQYICFSSSKNNEFVCIYSHKDKKIIQKIPIRGLFFTDFCKENLVIVYNSTISTYNIRKKELQHKVVKLVNDRTKITMNKAEQQLFLLSRLTLSVFDIRKNTIKTFPYEFSNLTASSNKKNFIAIGQSQLALLRDTGEVIISYYDLFSTKEYAQITNRKLSRTNDNNIYKLDFAPHYFLGIFKESSVDLVSSINGQKIITIDRAQNVTQTNGTVNYNSQLVPLTNGLLVSLLTKKNYEEYFFPFEKYSTNDNTKKTIQRLTVVYKTSREIGRSLLLGKDFVIYTSKVGFLGWKNNKFFEPRSVFGAKRFKLSNSGNYLAAIHRSGGIKLYETEKFTELSFDILGPQSRQIIKKFGNEKTQCILFSKDDKNIFLAKSSLELFTYNITTKKVSKISSLRTDKTLELVDMIQLEDNHLVVGFRETNNKNGGFAIYPPNGKINTYYKESYQPQALAYYGTRFAIALKNGDINIYEDPKKPKKIMSLRTPGIPQKLYFSPNGEYIAVFTVGEIYIFDISIYKENNNDKFRIYKGFFKNKVSVFSKNWEKVYFTNNAGDILIFDQKFFMDKNAYSKRLKKLSAFGITKLNDTRQEIENYLSK